MRFHYNKSATVKRLATYSGNKSAFASVAGTIRGFFIPLEPSQKTEALGIIDQAYEFTTDGQKDIKVNDTLTIDSIEYRVKGVARYTMFGQDVLKCTIQLMTNG